MPRSIHRWVGAVLAVACFVSIAQPVEAKRKRLNDKIMKEAVNLAKDREAKFAGEKAMDNEAFQAAWAAFTKKLSDEFEGHEVKLKKFGPDVRHRKSFSHVIYMALRSQTRGLELSPTAQEVVAAHPFIQELMLEGSCYTGGDPFPKKVSELLEANPGMPFLLAENLEGWDKKLRDRFKKAYPKVN